MRCAIWYHWYNFKNVKDNHHVLQTRYGDNQSYKKLARTAAETKYDADMRLEPAI